MATAVVPNPPTPNEPGSSRELTPGSVLVERYRIDERVGAGSTSEEYLAEHLPSGRKVVVKIVRQDHSHLAELVSRFEKEALAVAAIENPNIEGALEFGKLDDGSVFFVSEHVQGRTLRDELGGGPLSIERSLHVAGQVASVLADVHELGILHEDLKPENVMLLRRGEDADFVKVLGFGLADPAAPADASGKPGPASGTPGYRPPEQALGQSLDGRADLYALGVILFEMLAGVRPFEDVSGTLAKQLAGHVPTFAERAPTISVPGALEKLVQRLLAPNVSDRFATAEDLTEALTAVVTPQASPKAATLSERPVVIRSSAPPPPLRRTLSGPLPVLDRASPVEAPPQAKPSERPPAVAPTKSSSTDDSDIPTTVSLPRTSPLPAAPLPPLAPLPGRLAPASTALPAKPMAGGRGSGPASAKGPPSAGARARKVGSEWWKRAAPLGIRLRAARGVWVAGVAAVGLTAALLSLWAVRSSSRRAPEGPLATGDARPALLAGTHAASPDRPSLTAASHQLVNQESFAAAAAQPAVDEESVFLALAADYAKSRREGEAVALVARVLSRKPELKNDERVSDVLRTTVRAEGQQAVDDSFSLITSALGETGAELMYSLSVDPMVRDPLRRRIEAWLASKDFDRVSSAALYSAVKLRYAKTCDQKHALLSLAAGVGGKQTLELLRDFDAHTICGANDLKNCYPCLAEDSRLKDSIQRLERRLAAVN